MYVILLDPPNTDAGNFTGGIAVYIEGLEVVLKTQFAAGWYIYVMEWRFHLDGTLRPRFGFGAVIYGYNCVCQVHHHDVYSLSTAGMCFWHINSAHKNT